MSRKEYLAEFLRAVDRIIDEAIAKVQEETPEYYLSQAIADELNAVRQKIREDALNEHSKS